MLNFPVFAVMILFLTASKAFALTGLSELPPHGRAGIPLDDRYYLQIERMVIQGQPLDLLTNKPVFILDESEFVQRDTVSSSRRNRWLKYDRHIVKYRTDDGSSFTFDPRFTWRIDAGSDKTITRRGSGIQFYGSIRSRLGFYFRFVDNTESGNGPYTNRSQLIEEHYGYVGPLQGGDETYYDATEAYVNWGIDWLNVTFGKDKVSWGPGRRTNLLLSDNAPSFDQLRVKIDVTRSARFTYLVGKLHPTPGLTGGVLYETDDGWQRVVLEPKWLAAHRIEYSVTDWLLLSVSEAVIWGERGLDVSYLNPLYFLYSAQHDGGDRDNVAMSGDFIMRIGNDGIFYGALLIDDMKISRLGQGDPGNKFGILSGVFASGIGHKSIDAGLEYIRLEPFVYSHFFPINRFTNWNSSLGADLRPNSDRLELSLRWNPTFDLSFKLSPSFNRHGSLGGELDEAIPRNPGLSKARFLDGTRQTWSTYNIGVEWEAIPGGVIEIGTIRGDKQSIDENRCYLSIGYRI